jgi:hypothetical protein
MTFNPYLMLLIVLFSSAMVVLGIGDLNRHFARYGNRISDREGRKLVWDLYGRIDFEKVSQRRRQVRRQASHERDAEWDSLVRFAKTLVP